MIDFNELLLLLNSHSNFLITCHVNPDADAIGSEIAIAKVLEQLGKNYYIINTSETPYNLEFLDINNKIQKYNDNEHAKIFELCDASILLDLNQLNRTVRMYENFKKFKGTKICLDHHTDSENFTEYIFIDESKSSTGEIIYDLIDYSDKLKFNYEIALEIYAAIMTDTGSFRFSKTNAEVHRKVANLLSYGLNTEDIYDKIYAQYEFSRNKLLGKTLNSIELTDSKKISYLVVTQNIVNGIGAVESDVDGFVNYALTTKGVEIAILFYELKDGVKISFRSKKNIPVNKLAQQFGGGGHVNASGTRLFNINLHEILPKVLTEAEKLVK